MRKMLLGMSAVLAVLVPLSAQAHDDWRNNHWQMRDLRQACDWGDRRACVRLGREIEQRREERRDRWETARERDEHWRDRRWERRW